MNVRLIITSCLILALSACGPAKKATGKKSETLTVVLDLIDISDDQVKVRIDPPNFDTETTTFMFPKIIPGTYSVADYGRAVENFTAFDSDGNELAVSRLNTNTWVIEGASRLDYITYRVNDTFDSEKGDVFTPGGTDIFSPAGTNISAGENFVLNMAGFAGYFEGKEDIPYILDIDHPEDLFPATALTDENKKNNKAVFTVNRYAEVVDNPIMFAPSEAYSFMEGDMEVILQVYAPEGSTINAESLAPGLETMMQAQKNYLGPINNTSKYAILTYITTGKKDDAQGIGALEHNYSTTAVFRQSMTEEDLVGVISHEFFHTLTPLNVHSENIQYWNFNDPDLSKHLWMYEGITEYFAQHFQVAEGLVGEQEFLDRMYTKISTSHAYKSDLSFTEMSDNVLEPGMHEQFPNVYLKGALMAMCLDIIIRENSNGERGLLDVMGQLSEMYGPEKPFKEDEIISVFTEITYPEVGSFLNEHIVAGIPVDYDHYLHKVGINKVAKQVPEQIAFIRGKIPYIQIDQAKQQVVATLPDDQNAFFSALGVEQGDILLELNKQPFDSEDLMSVAMLGYGLKEGDPVSLKIERNGEEQLLEGTVKLNYKDGETLSFTDESKTELKNAWLMKE